MSTSRTLVAFALAFLVMEAPAEAAGLSLGVRGVDPVAPALQLRVEDADLAATGPRGTDREDYWRDVDHRALNVYRAGLITGGVGLVLAFVPQESVSTIGSLALLAAPPMMAASSLRSRKALFELGGEADGKLGTIGLGCYLAVYPAAVLTAIGFVYVFSDTYPVAGATMLVVGGIATPVLYISSVVLVIMQGNQNARERRFLSVASAERAPKKVQLVVLPQLSRDAQGLAFVGTF